MLSKAFQGDGGSVTKPADKPTTGKKTTGSTSKLAASGNPWDVAPGRTIYGQRTYGGQEDGSETGQTGFRRRKEAVPRFPGSGRPSKDEVRRRAARTNDVV